MYPAAESVGFLVAKAKFSYQANCEVPRAVAAECRGQYFGRRSARVADRGQRELAGLTGGTAGLAVA